MTPTKGRKPKVVGPWIVQFRSGVVSGPYETDALRWTDTGDSFDVVAIRAAAGEPYFTRMP